MSDTAGDLPRLTAAQAAARLRVKPETLYAYVSRGRLTRQRGPSGSTFDPLEVEAFAARRRISGNDASRPVNPPGTPLMTIETDVAQIEDDELYYRGVSATELAGRGDFEQVCRWLWPPVPVEGRFATPSEVRARLAVVLPSTGQVVDALDRMHLAVVAAAGADPLRQDLSPANVARQAGGLIATMADALPVTDPDLDPGRDPAPAGASLARRLWPRLSPQRPLRRRVRVLDAALVLLIDHDLAASTMAVRVAASARANLYAAVSAGLGAFDSALHGTVSRPAYSLLGQLLAGRRVGDALQEAVATTGGVPGFGHRIYRRRDPRAVALIGLLAELGEGAAVVGAYQRLEHEVRSRTGSFPNVDLALAAMAHAFGMGPDAGSTVFALGRTGGWVCHVLREYAEAPLRLRPVGHYVDPLGLSDAPVRM